MSIGDKILEVNSKYQERFTDLDTKKLDRGGQI